MKDTVTEMMRNLLGINSRVDEAKNQISDLEYKEAKNNQSEQQEEEGIQKNESVRSLWDNFNHTNLHIMRVQKGEESKKLKTFLK